MVLMSTYYLGPIFIATSFLFTSSYQDDVKLTKDLRYNLNSGNSMPLVGFGTYLIQGTQFVRNILDRAFAAGYRAIDTAPLYGNEEDIGKALKQLLPKYNLTRQDIFIITKLDPSKQGERAYEGLEKSLRNLDCGYIDLYLIHTPGTAGLSANDKELPKRRDLSWQNLVRGLRNGLIRSIGVSNYNVRHLKQLLANDHGVKPAVNQVELHPHCRQTQLLELCKKEGILLQAYFSLGGTNNKDLVEDVRVKGIAKKLGKSTAQVLLRWPIQQGIAIIPKARSKGHIEDNIDLNFVIPDEEMRTLGNFSQKRYGLDPDVVF